MRKRNPQFRSLAEEMEFWDTHDATEIEAKEVTVEEILDELKQRRSKQRLTVSVDSELLARLKSLGAKRHLPTSAVVRELLWDGVKETS